MSTNAGGADDAPAGGETVLPLLRAGRWYRSRDTAEVPGVPDPRLRVSLAPEILIRDDARRLRDRRRHWPALEPGVRLALLDRAVEEFRHGEVPVGGLGTQDPDGFERIMRACAGLPAALVRRWSAMLRDRLALLRPADADDTAISLVSLPANTFTCLESVLEAALVSGAVWIRPSRREPVASARLVGALISAGWPPERLGWYPTSPDMLTALVRATTRQVVYGGEAVAARTAEVSSLDLRGPGRTCVIVDQRATADPAPLADRLAHLVAADAGRFCTNASVIVCRGDPDVLARPLADLLDGIRLDPPDPRHPLASCTAGEGRRVERLLDRYLTAGARVLTRRPTLTTVGTRTFLAPTLVQVPGIDHPLVGCELPFPFAVLVPGDGTAAERLGAGFVYEDPYSPIPISKGAPP